jgi:predicted RNA-binding protein with RPS1 domain
MCYEDDNNCNSIGTQHNSTSINELLKINFDINDNIKEEIHELMSNSPYLWKTRPIPYKLNYYAGSDVLYLPQIYDLILQKCEKKIVKKITIEDIFQECQKYLEYLKINKNIKNYNKMNLKKGTKIKGLIKNLQHHCVYVQLNIGYIGIVDIYPSVQLIIKKYKYGDIVDFIIMDIENKKKRMLLDISEKEKEIKDNIEDEKRNYITIGKNTFENDIKKNNDSDSDYLLHGLNINKEGFFPKSYIKGLRNGNGYNYYNGYNKNYQYNKENRKNYQYNDTFLNNEIFNSNYNGLFYNNIENYYYYDKNDDNNEENEEANSDSYYYTLKPFPK